MSKRAKRRRLVTLAIEHLIGAAVLLAGIYGVCYLAGLACGALGVL